MFEIATIKLIQHSGKEDIICKYCLTKASKIIDLFFGFILVFTKWKTKCMFWKFDHYVHMPCEESWPSSSYVQYSPPLLW